MLISYIPLSRQLLTEQPATLPEIATVSRATPVHSVKMMTMFVATPPLVLMAPVPTLGRMTTHAPAHLGTLGLTVRQRWTRVTPQPSPVRMEGPVQ